MEIISEGMANVVALESSPVSMVHKKNALRNLELTNLFNKKHLQLWLVDAVLLSNFYMYNNCTSMLTKSIVVAGVDSVVMHPEATHLYCLVNQYGQHHKQTNKENMALFVHS